MRTFQVKNLFLILLLLTVLLAACSKREVTGSSEEMSASAVSVSAESVVSSASSDVQITSELVATSSKESAAPEVSQSAPVSSSSQAAEYVSSEPVMSSSAVEMPEAPELFFRNEAVQDIYAFAPSTYTTVLLGTEFSTEALVELLEEMPENTTRTKETERAFIVFTEQGRYYIYLDRNKTPEALLKLWEDAVSSAEKGRHIQWLTHMTPEKITEIRAGGLGKTLTERADIEAAAEFLKKEVFVGQIEKIHASEGEDNPNMLGGLYHIVITFDTGVIYSMIGYGDVDGHIDEGGSYLSIWTSDLDKTVYYTLTEGCAAEIRKFFGQLH